MAKQGKRLKGAYETVDRLKLHALDEAVKLVKGGAKAKFDETVEISMNLRRRCLCVSNYGCITDVRL